jgi:hypothetical protein
VETVQKIIDKLRGKGAATPSGRPVDQRRRGYQLAAKEAQVMGERVPSYEEWLSKQPAEL